MSTTNNSDDEEKYSAIKEVPVNEELLEALHEAGASRLFIKVVQVDPSAVGASRNSAREEVRKYCYWADEISASVIEEKKNYGGHFFQTLWEGDREKARSRADSNNQRILREVAGDRPGVQSL